MKGILRALFFVLCISTSALVGSYCPLGLSIVIGTAMGISAAFIDGRYLS